jgi:hypothetical protein
VTKKNNNLEITNGNEKFVEPAPPPPGEGGGQDAGFGWKGKKEEGRIYTPSL